jgi:hypothetical protein
LLCLYPYVRPNCGWPGRCFAAGSGSGPGEAITDNARSGDALMPLHNYGCSTKAIYSARKYTVEPVIGVIKEILGFRQFSLRGMQAAEGEWYLVCLAFNLKRFHTLSCA